MRRVLILALFPAWLGCDAKPSKATAKGCDLAGTYRLRFDAMVGQWLWFRFEVAPGATSAKLVPPIAIGATDKPLKLDPDPAACKLSVIAPTKRGDLLASITLDAKTNAVTGTLRGVGMREGVKLEGVRDVGPQQSPHACVVPGMYHLVIPPEQPWMNDQHRSCDTAQLKVPFLVEYLGDRLMIDQLDAKGGAEWTAEDVFEIEPCHVEVRFRHHEWSAYAKLVFAGDNVTATATRAMVQVSHDGELWKCEVANPMAWVER